MVYASRPPQRVGFMEWAWIVDEKMDGVVLNIETYTNCKYSRKVDLNLIHPFIKEPTSNCKYSRKVDLNLIHPLIKELTSNS